MKKLGYPLRWDWRDKGAVTPIRDQGHFKDAFNFGLTLRHLFGVDILFRATLIFT